MSSTDEVQDQRKAPFSWFEPAIVKVYGPIIGPVGMAAYMSLVAHANEKRSCFPAVSTIAGMIDSGESTVRAYLHFLQALKLIKIVHRKTGVKDNDSNVYILLDPPPVPLLKREDRPTLKASARAKAKKALLSNGGGGLSDRVPPPL